MQHQLTHIRHSICLICSARYHRKGKSRITGGAMQPYPCIWNEGLTKWLMMKSKTTLFGVVFFAVILSAKEQSMSRKDNGTAAQRVGGRIHIVDDGQVIQKLLPSFLSEKSFISPSASSAEDGMTLSTTYGMIALHDSTLPDTSKTERWGQE